MPHESTFARSLITCWQRLDATTRATVSDLLAAAVLAELQKDPWYSSFSNAPRVEVLGASERDGAICVHYVADHLNYCLAQSGSDWADHNLFAGELWLRDGQTSQVRAEQVGHVNVTEREWDDGYDREPPFCSLRVRELARLEGAAARPQ
jgi:hypothetical protein